MSALFMCSLIYGYRDKKARIDQTRSFGDVRVRSALPLVATISRTLRHFRKGPMPEIIGFVVIASTIMAVAHLRHVQSYLSHQT